MKLLIALGVAALSTAAIAQNHPGGVTGHGDNLPDSRDARIVDEHMHHGVPAYHGRQRCVVSHRHGHSYRKCKPYHR